MLRKIINAIVLINVITLHSFAQQKSVSILGDSYSTFQGYLTPDTNAIYYSSRPWGNMDVKSASDTWWMKYIKDSGSKLCINNSFSGSTVCYTGYNKADAAHSSFISRMSNLGCPDVIFIFGGTNDSWAGVPMGEYKYADWARQDLYSFRPAMAYMLSWMKERYVNTEIYFLLNDGLTDEVNQTVETVCARYEVPVIKLHDITKTMGHPDKAGMSAIASQITKFVTSYKSR